MKKQKPQAKTLNPIHPSINVEKDYFKKIKAMMRSINIEAIPLVTAIILDKKTPVEAAILTQAFALKIKQSFSGRIIEYATSFVREINKDTSRKLNNEFSKVVAGVTIDPVKYTQSVGNILEASIANNVALIKTIPEQYLAQVEQGVQRAILANNGYGQLIDDLQSQYGLSLKRAKMIVQDQTAKVYADITKGRALELGLKKFQWLHTSGSNKPRPLHIDLNNKIFEWSKPPITNDKGERNLPAQEINCRCLAKIVVEF